MVLCLAAISLIQSEYDRFFSWTFRLHSVILYLEMVDSGEGQDLSLVFPESNYPATLVKLGLSAAVAANLKRFPTNNRLHTEYAWDMCHGADRCAFDKGR
jgi:hypothetical protein